MKADVFLSAVAAGWVFATVCRWIALRTGFVAQSNTILREARPPVPYLGGLALMLGAYLPCLWVLAPGLGVPLSSWPWPILVGGAGFMLLGLADDLWRFSARRKFAWQLTILMVVFCVEQYVAPEHRLVHAATGVPLLDVALCGFWVLVVVNAMNLIDVSDGLAASVAALTFFFFGFFFSPHAALSLSLAGACLGFLLWNLPPARLYMGDSGSQFLGFMVAAMSLTESVGLSLWPGVPILFLWAGVPFYELLFLIVTRRRKGIPWYAGSPDHFAIRLQRSGHTKWDVIAYASLGVLICWSLALGMQSLPMGFQLGLLALALHLALTLWRYLSRWEPDPAATLADPTDARG